MSNKIEYSRFRFKRSTILGVEPTIPTATTIDNTWLNTDLLIGEGFINVEDDKFWFRTNNGLVEVSLSGISSDNYYTELAYLSGSTLVFDRNDTAEAYSVDLSSISLTGDYLPLSGGTMTGNFTAETIYLKTADQIRSVNGNAYLALDEKGSAGAILLSTDGASAAESNIQMNPELFLAEVDGTTLFKSTPSSVSIGNSTANSAKPSLIVSSQNSSIPSGITNSVILGGNSITASASDTAYVDNLNISTVGGGTPLYDLGIDANGFVVSGGTAFAADTYLAKSGGTMTGDLVVEANLTVTGDTYVQDFSATTVSILNSGATVQDYTDYSSNTIESGVTDSSIVAGSGNTIVSGVRNVLVAGFDLTGDTSDTAYFSNVIGAPYDFNFAVTDETTAITTGTDKIALYAPRDFEISKVKISLTTTGSTTTTVDVNVGGTTILSSPVSLTSGVYVNSTTSLSTTSISEDDRITVDIDSAGTDAAGLKVYLIGKNNS